MGVKTPTENQRTTPARTNNAHFEKMEPPKPKEGSCGKKI